MVRGQTRNAADAEARTAPLGSRNLPRTHRPAVGPSHVSRYIPVQRRAALTNVFPANLKGILKPWQPPTRTIQVEFLPLEQRTGSTGTEAPELAYVDTENIEFDHDGHPTCRLSEILPLAASCNSPLKSKRSRRWGGCMEPNSLFLHQSPTSAFTGSMTSSIWSGLGMART